MTHDIDLLPPATASQYETTWKHFLKPSGEHCISLSLFGSCRRVSKWAI